MFGNRWAAAGVVELLVELGNRNGAHRATVSDQRALSSIQREELRFTEAINRWRWYPEQPQREVQLAPMMCLMFEHRAQPLPCRDRRARRRHGAAGPLFGRQRRE